MTAVTSRIYTLTMTSLRMPGRLASLDAACRRSPPVLTRWLCVGLLLWPLASPGQGNGIEESDGVSPTPHDALARPDLGTFSPPPDPEFDWIQLDSGEWLKGDLKALYNFQLEFDSDELGLQTFDWEDIRRLRTAGPQELRVENGDGLGTPMIVFGVLTVVDGKAYVGEGAEPRVFDRDQIVTIAVGTQRRSDWWSGDILLGINLRQGNSDLADATLAVSVKRQRAVSRLMASYLGNYSRAEGEKTSNNHRMNAYFDVFESTRFFWRPVFAEYYRDPFKNIEHQASLSLGLGYDLIRTAQTEWNVTAVAGSLYKRFESVQPGQDEENTSPILGLGTRYDTEIRDGVDYLFDFGFYVTDEDTGQYIHHLVTTLSTDFVADLDVGVSLIWDRVEEPQASAAGELPEQDDFQLIFSLGYEF